MRPGEQTRTLDGSETSRHYACVALHPWHCPRHGVGSATGATPRRHNVGMFLNRPAFLFVLLVSSASLAQSNQTPSVTLPTVIVTAEREATDIKDVPGSVTA